MPTEQELAQCTAQFQQCLQGLIGWPYTAESREHFAARFAEEFATRPGISNVRVEGDRIIATVRLPIPVMDIHLVLDEDPCEPVSPAIDAALAVYPSRTRERQQRLDQLAEEPYDLLGPVLPDRQRCLS